MGYLWALPIVIVSIIALVIATGARRRRDVGSAKESKD